MVVEHGACVLLIAVGCAGLRSRENEEDGGEGSEEEGLEQQKKARIVTLIDRGGDTGHVPPNVQKPSSIRGARFVRCWLEEGRLVGRMVGYSNRVM